MRRKLASETTPKIKKKPRGRPFVKGNTLAQDFWYRPGQSGNPSGKPAHKEVSKALRARLAELAPGDKLGRSNAEMLADQWIRVGLSGNIPALISLTDRAEGKPAVVVGVSGTPDGLRELIEGVEEVHKQLGHPEGFIARPQLKTVESVETPEETERNDA
jgi:hypothetical protein